MAAESRAVQSAPHGVQFVAVRANYYRLYDEICRRLHSQGSDPKSVVGVDPERPGSIDLSHGTILSGDADWLTFLDTRSIYFALKDEREKNCPRWEKNLKALDRAEGNDLRFVFRGRCDFDTSLDEAGQQNDLQDFLLAEKSRHNRARYWRRRSELIGKLCLPDPTVPLGWESLKAPFYEIKALIDVEPWLDRALKYIRELQALGPNKEIARDEGVNTVNNFFILLDELKISNRPKRPDLSKTKSEYPEVDAAVSDLLAWVRRRLAAVRSLPHTDVATDRTIEVQVDARPKQYLANWREILDALEMPNNPEKRTQVRKSHELHESPIVFGGRGSQPRVERSKLIEWWNGLEDRFEKSVQKRLDRTATVEAQYEHGRKGVVVPGIDGAVKVRRGSTSHKIEKGRKTS